MSEPSIGAAQPGTAHPPGALTADDYQQLRTMALSDDARVRDQATTLAQKLTPAEATAFVAVQKDAHRQSLIDSGRLKPGAPDSATLEHRDDNTLFGMPPETVVAMGIPVARAILGPGLTMTARAVLGTKAAATQATPLLKFEFTKSALEKMHVPSSLAWIAAAAVSGYRGNGKTLAPTEEVPPAVEGYDRYMPNTSGAASPVPVRVVDVGEGPIDPVSAVRRGTAPASAPAGAPPTPTLPVAAAPASTGAPIVDTPPPPPATASPASPAAAPGRRPLSPGHTLDLPMAQRTKGQQSVSWVQSDLGIAARRQGVTLSDAESTAAETLMRDHGVSANEAVQTVGQLQAKRTPSGLTLSPEEASQFDALKQQGQSGAQAEAAILKLRTLAKKLKTPSSDQVTDAVKRRNETGRWDE
jgi:hypothetical protein